MSSRAEAVSALPERERRAFFAALAPEELESLTWDWRFWARPDQIAPAGDWRTWLLLGGRGSGKTRTATEWIRSELEAGRHKRFAVIGPTSDSVRRVMVEGPSGLIATAPPHNRPAYEPSIRRVVWPNGAVCNIYTAEEPDRLRGENADAAWCDELCSWSNLESTWNMLQMCLRLPGPQGDSPRVIVTTTPRPSATLKAILAASNTVTSRSRTADNAANLDTSTLQVLNETYGGTSLGRQELDAELVEDMDGALWTRSLIERSRVVRAPELKRIVVAVDPAGSHNKGSDETGIVVAGRGQDDHCYVLADLSGQYSPEGWARRAIEAYRGWRADRIVAESNFGGAMVESTLRTVAPNIPLKLLHASRGKAARAEPVVSLYEQGKCHHVGTFLAMEDQMCSWDPLSSSHSPDRLDALVWCATELMLHDARPAYRAPLGRFINLNRW